jgi:hypothetical protein
VKARRNDGWPKTIFCFTFKIGKGLVKNKIKEKQKYKPLSEATQEELDTAFLMAALWVTTELEGRTGGGAFSEAYLGVPAAEYFPRLAYKKLKDPACRWKWKEGTKLSTLMINVIKSDMAHKLRDFMDDDGDGGQAPVPTLKISILHNCSLIAA